MLTLWICDVEKQIGINCLYLVLELNDGKFEFLNFRIKPKIFTTNVNGAQETSIFVRMRGQLYLLNFVSHHCNVNDLPLR